MFGILLQVIADLHSSRYCLLFSKSSGNSNSSDEGIAKKLILTDSKSEALVSQEKPASVPCRLYKNDSTCGG